MSLMLMKAAARGQLAEVVRLLEEPSIDPAADASRVVRIAARLGGANVLRELLADPRVDPGANGNAAVRSAAEAGKAECVAMLLDDPRVDPLQGSSAQRSLLQEFDARAVSAAAARRATGNTDRKRWELLRCLVRQPCVVRTILPGIPEVDFESARWRRQPSKSTLLEAMRRYYEDGEPRAFCAMAWRRRRAVVLARWHALSA